MALAVERGVPRPEVPPDALRAALRAQHVQLAWPMSEGVRVYLMAGEQ